jgi:lipid-binding SYLF domain-containing protein
MNRFRTPLIILSLFATGTAWGSARELKTVESATEAVHALANIPLKGIPRSLLEDAAGVAVIPHVVKFALIVDHAFGHGVVCVHEADGRWSNPVFVTFQGRGIGGEAGIESTDLVLVFKTKKSLDLALKGKLTLGGDAAVAAGPIGRESEKASDRPLKADIYTYSRSRGLYAGISLEGSRLHMDEESNEAFYCVRGGHATDVLALSGVPIPVAAVKLTEELLKLSLAPPPAPPGIILPRLRP